ncbi:Toxin FitB [Tepidimonas alkaliphilus]|uniref:Ribonuclease VapC n=1 Tax=Tepidimonas alkaliphilus TaxID=2588942 RepID=A0A554W7F1_9BURK|nr:type II toxin-antitoxin system VapC family toxin [Tepidimonas alkaliphilus]TSE19495.1 Toxin FitB [Tepidimonas alkaliphilus]
MILLDTNVLSEVMRPQPSETVMASAGLPVARTGLGLAISRAEIMLGLELMPAGRRQAALAQAAEALFTQDFAGRCLPFDEQAALHYAAIVAQRTRAGRPISTEDAQIAAIARQHGLTRATRNEADFQGVAGLTVINPWQAGA